MPGVRKVPGRSGGEPTRPIDAATWCLIALVIAGVALRVVTEVSWWPTATTLADSSAYASFAESNPFADPQHPAGYALILAAIGSVTREVAVPVVLQHLAGIASALLLYAATRRVTGSMWAGLLPAAIVLLNPDEILLEHAIMAESWAILATAGGLYATVRAFDEPRSALALAAARRRAARPLGDHSHRRPGDDRGGPARPAARRARPLA